MIVTYAYEHVTTDVNMLGRFRGALIGSFGFV